MPVYYEGEEKINALKQVEKTLKITDDTVKNILLNLSKDCFDVEFVDVKVTEDTHSLEINAPAREGLPFILFVYTEDEITESSTIIGEIVILLSSFVGKKLGTTNGVYGKVLVITGSSSATTVAAGSTITSLTGTGTSSMQYYYDEGVFKASQSSNYFKASLKYKCLFVFMKE